MNFADKHMTSLFSMQAEERVLPEASFTDLAVIFAAVALARNIEFSSIAEHAERAVIEAQAFFQEMLNEHKRSGDVDVISLSRQNESMKTFLETQSQSLFVPRGDLRWPQVWPK